MTCRKAKKLLKDKGRDDHSSADYNALVLHLKSCPPCGEAMQIARLSSALLQTLREETGPGPTFYPRLRARLEELEISQPDIRLLHAWGFARRLIPALAMGALLLSGVTLTVGGSCSTLLVQVRGGTEVSVFLLGFAAGALSWSACSRRGEAMPQAVWTGMFNRERYVQELTEAVRLQPGHLHARVAEELGAGALERHAP